MTDRQIKIYRAFTALAGLALVEDQERFAKYGFQIYVLELRMEKYHGLMYFRGVKVMT